MAISQIIVIALPVIAAIAINYLASRARPVRGRSYATG